MQFYVLHIEQENDSSVRIFGNEIIDLKTKTYSSPKSILVKNIITPYLFANSDNLEKKIIEYLDQKKIMYKIENIKMHNFFYKKINNEVDILRVTTTTKVNYSKFEEVPDFMTREFANPVEQLIILSKIKGPGVVEISDYEISVDDDIIVSDFTKVKFVKHDSFPILNVGFLQLEIENSEILSFCLKIVGALNQIFIGTRNYKFFKERNDLEAQNVKTFQYQNEISNYINQLIIKNKLQIVVHHNLSKSLFLQMNLSGVIICDNFALAMTLTKGKDYTIDELVKNLKITKNNKNILFSEKFSKIIKETENLSLIFESLDILELSKQMTEISGNLLARTMANQRAERIEFFLLHEMFERKYLFPEKSLCKTEFKYTGGLVLDPVTGFYETLILLLDFNSLYPSLIQEYNICFSTIGFENFKTENEQKNNEDEYKEFENKYKDKETGFLPKILANLVKRRKSVKDLIKSTKDMKEKRSLEIRQIALKLTANSIYGCLGSPFSRFSNHTMASYITYKGRELLRETKNIAENLLKMKVIYGDTDSIMIDTRLLGININYEAALRQSVELKNKINIKYKFIEIEVEKIMKKLLLYTKKKYGCLYIDKNYNSFIESKGLDFTRRDFSIVSNNLTSDIFETLLIDLERDFLKFYEAKDFSGNFTADNFVRNNGNPILLNMIFNKMANYKENIEKLPIEHFVINVQFKRDPSQYNLAINLPHVNLALRLKEKGVMYKKDDIISYVIGKGKNTDSLYNRTFLVNEKYILDHSYYIEHQILPSLHRILSLFTGISAEETNKIFGIMKIFNEVQKKKITIYTPCCQRVQEPLERCEGCLKIIPISFYKYKVYELIRREAKNLYLTESRCNDCGFTTNSFFRACPNCKIELFEIINNAAFDEFLTNLQSSFNSFDECAKIIENAIDSSAYRVIDFKKYFGDEILQYLKEIN
ncbi:DNA-directed DNA polymerase alpha catalytic subunit pol1 [Gurleya vavrai]